jgi:6-pyruvoyltetrahydropterin/6-carboxytetrahydropterin synthase
MTESIFEITKSATFEAAHYLGHGPAESRYRRLHGHSFKVEASVRGAALGEDGWVADLADLDAALHEITGELDHGLLNELPGLETPTLERICLHFAGKLKSRFPGLSRIVISRPSVGESCALSLLG